MSSLRFLRRFRRLFGPFRALFKLLELTFFYFLPEMASWLAIRSSPMLWRSAARLISPRSSSRLDIRREIPAILGGAAGHQCVPTTTRHLHLSPKNARQSYTSQYRRFANSSRRSDKRSSGPNSSGDSTGQAPTLTQRLKNLSRKYGWVAVAVYLALSVIDFPICFFMVRGMGVEQIGRLERTAVDTTKKVFGSIWPGRPENGGESSEQQEEAPQEKPLKDHEASKFLFWFLYS